MNLALFIPLAVCVLALSNLGRFLLTGKWLYPFPVSGLLVLVAFLGLMLSGCAYRDPAESCVDAYLAGPGAVTWKGRPMEVLRIAGDMVLVRPSNTIQVGVWVQCSSVTVAGV